MKADALAFVIMFHGRMYLAVTPLQNERNDPFANTGWRPYCWTDRLDRAQKWATRPEVEAFASWTLPGGYEIRPIYGASPRSVA